MLLIDRIAEEKIQEAIEKGEFNNFSLKGKPYRLDGYLFEDQKTRIQNKILRDHNLLPLPLQIKKEIEKQKEKLAAFGKDFRKVYVRKLQNILNILDTSPNYLLTEYEQHITKHQIYMNEYLPQIIKSRQNSNLQMEVFLFNRSINSKYDKLNESCNQLKNLIEEYNEEIRKATLKKRDMFRNFTTLGTRWIECEKVEFYKRFPKIPVEV